MNKYDMIPKFKKTINTDYTMYIIIGLLSAAIFCMIYGVKVLNPTYTDWLMAGGDLSQHYLGWKAFRASAWHFPIGMSDTLAYPNNVSIIFTDSIPIFAVFFKILSPILPTNFQYFGLWGIMCFILQGVLSGRIIKNFSPNKLLTIITSLIFPLTPVVIWRMFGHTSLAGQWIILYGLDIIFNEERYKEKNLYITIGIMGLLAASIHMYFVLMCGIILIGFLIKQFLNKKRFRTIVLALMIYLLSVAAVTFVLGGFSSSAETGAGGLGIYSFNLNGFLNPQGWSGILKDRYLFGEGQYEGFAYLGAGCILLAVFSIFAFISRNDFLNVLARWWKSLIALLSAFFLAVIVAMSPIITLSGRLIAQLTIPEFVTNLWSIFRASGRIVWVGIYIIMLTSIIVILKCVNKRTAYFIFAFSLFLQPYDIKQVLAQRNEYFNTVIQYDSPLDSTEFWNKLANDQDIRHIVYYSGVNESLLYSITDWALTNNKTVNNFYFARGLEDVVTINREKSLSELPQDTIFIFNENEKNECLTYNLHYYAVDNMIIGCSKVLNGSKELTKQDLITE